MTIVNFEGNSYECARAVRGVNYIKLYDENNVSIAAFQGISDFSAFTLQEGEWEPGISTDIVGANAEFNSGRIYLTLLNDVAIETGLTITFKAPCNCTQVGNIIIQDATLSMVNAVGVPIASNFEAFKSGALVTIVLSLEDSRAYIQNGDASAIENGGTGASTPQDALKKLGGLSAPILLWENASPTSEFGQQSISLDLSEYSFLVIEFCYSASLDNGEKIGCLSFPTYLIKENKYLPYSPPMFGYWSDAHYRRLCWINSPSSITFLPGYTNNAQNSATQDNNVCIPLTIWGIK